MSDDWLDRLVDSQPLGSLAYPYLTGRQRYMAVAETKRLAIRDVRDFLAGIGDENQFEEMFTTDRRVEQLEAALDAFEKTVRAWAEGHRRNDRFTWILPNRLLASVMEGRLAATLAGRLATVDLGNRIRSLDSSWMWLPYITLEGTNIFQNFQSGDRAVASLMISRGCRQLGSQSSARPWRPGFPFHIAALPVNWLYQFDPTAKAITILERLTNAGLTNIGHLVVLHPDAWSLLRSNPGDQWRALYRSLRRAGG